MLIGLFFRWCDRKLRITFSEVEQELHSSETKCRPMSTDLIDQKLFFALYNILPLSFGLLVRKA